MVDIHDHGRYEIRAGRGSVWPWAVAGGGVRWLVGSGGLGS